MADETEAAQHAAGEAAAGATPGPTATAATSESPNAAGTSLGSQGSNGGDASPSRTMKRDPEGKSKRQGPRDWEEMKAWVRREITLSGEGHTAEERDALNP